jgi:transcriptional regulator with XRE-family HTH domain
MNIDLAEKIRLRSSFPSPTLRRHLRERAGLTQQDVADALGVDRATVARYELGQRTPGGDLLARYSSLLDELMQTLGR